MIIIVCLIVFDLGGLVNKVVGVIVIGFVVDGIFLLIVCVLVIVILLIGFGFVIVLDKYVVKCCVFDENLCVVGIIFIFLGFIVIGEGVILFML